MTELEQIKFAKWLKQKGKVYEHEIPKNFDVDGSSKYFTQWHDDTDEDEDGYVKSGAECYFYLSDKNKDALSEKDKVSISLKIAIVAVIISALHFLFSFRQEILSLLKALM